MAGSTATYRTVQASALRTGLVLESPICDQNGRKLLGAGIGITEALLHRLQEREIHSVLVTENDASRLREPRKEEEVVRPPLSAEDSYVDAISRDIRRGFESSSMQALLRRHRQAAGTLQRYLANLASEEFVRLEVAEALVQELYVDMQAEVDLCLCLSSMPTADRYPSRHSFQTAMIAMALARTMRYQSSEILELGIGCLLHDVGMLRVPPNRYRVRRSLNVDEFSDIARHPVMTFELLQEHIDAVPTNARMVAYQIHERFNGSGYPRGRTGSQIHPLARIAAVADTYVALVSPRPHREALSPYAAVEKLLRAVKLGLYDPEVARALLHTTSLFPIGSRVLLSDGRQGRVVRANGTHYDRPVVEVLGEADGELLDLSQTRSLNVSGSLPA